jgi:hypothetical protein
MIKHIVMWKLRGDTPEQKRLAIAPVKSQCEGLRGRIPGLSHIETGTDISGVDHACDVVLYSEFDSQSALAADAEHPAHIAVRDAPGDLRIARHQVDYPAPAR